MNFNQKKKPSKWWNKRESGANKRCKAQLNM